MQLRLPNTPGNDGHFAFLNSQAASGNDKALIIWVIGVLLILYVYEKVSARARLSTGSWVGELIVPLFMSRPEHKHTAPPRHTPNNIWATYQDTETCTIKTTTTFQIRWRRAYKTKTRQRKKITSIKTGEYNAESRMWNYKGRSFVFLCLKACNQRSVESVWFTTIDRRTRWDEKSPSTANSMNINCYSLLEDILLSNDTLLLLRWLDRRRANWPFTSPGVADESEQRSPPLIYWSCQLITATADLKYGIGLVSSRWGLVRRRLTASGAKPLKRNSCIPMEITRRLMPSDMLV